MSFIISIVFAIIYSYIYWYCFENYDTKVALGVAFVVSIVRGFFMSNGNVSLISIIISSIILAALNTALCKMAYDRSSSFLGFFIVSLIISTILGFVVAIILGLLFSLMIGIIL